MSRIQGSRLESTGYRIDRELIGLRCAGKGVQAGGGVANRIDDGEQHIETDHLKHLPYSLRHPGQEQVAAEFARLLPRREDRFEAAAGYVVDAAHIHDQTRVATFKLRVEGGFMDSACR